MIRASAGQSLDLDAAAGELVLEPLEAAVEMIDAVDDRLAARGEPGNHQRHRGAQVRRHHLGAGQRGLAGDRRHLPVDLDIGAEAGKFESDLTGAKVLASVVGEGRGEKILVFKLKRKKQYKKMQGHRQNYVEVKINEILVNGKSYK